jgi:hypothetical protein
MKTKGRTMAKYTKFNMKFHHYSWTTMAEDDPKVSGEPGSTLFSRNEGNEVLYMINKVMDHRELLSVDSGQKVEVLIKENLPDNLHSQLDVFNWINENW